jgi:hypothetical protein
MTDVRVGRFLVRVTACHVATYFVCGAIAYYAFDYAGAFSSPDISCDLRPISSKWIPLGPSLERGARAHFRPGALSVSESLSRGALRLAQALGAYSGPS